MRHNNLRDITVELLSKVCNDVAIEPPLQNLSGEAITPQSANRQDDVRADIHACGFLGRRKSAGFFDIMIRVFHTELTQYFYSIYRRHEQQKKREYGDRVRAVELASFTPLVFSTINWGYGQGSSQFCRRLAEILTRRNIMTYSSTFAWLRCFLSFSLLRSATMCIRGSRSISYR